MFVLVAIKVKPIDFTNGQLRDLINGEDGLLKEALKRGDLQEMVEIINSVGSILNYDGRQAAQKNLTGTEAEEEKESKDTRAEVCAELTMITTNRFLHICTIMTETKKSIYPARFDLWIRIEENFCVGLNSLLSGLISRTLSAYSWFSVSRHSK